MTARLAESRPSELSGSSDASSSNNVGGTAPNTLQAHLDQGPRGRLSPSAAGRRHAIAAVPLMLEHSGGGGDQHQPTMGRLAARGFAASAAEPLALHQLALDLMPVSHRSRRVI